MGNVVQFSFGGSGEDGGSRDDQAKAVSVAVVALIPDWSWGPVIARVCVFFTMATPEPPETGVRRSRRARTSCSDCQTKGTLTWITFTQSYRSFPQTTFLSKSPAEPVPASLCCLYAENEYLETEWPPCLMDKSWFVASLPLIGWSNTHRISCKNCEY